jgi:mRNA interferase HigB
VHIISKRPFNDAANNYPNCREAIMDTYNTLKTGIFKAPEELRMFFPSLDNLPGQMVDY